MQSGEGLGRWILSFNNFDHQIEPLMGRTSSANMYGEVKLKFDSMESAVLFAKNNNYNYELEEPKQRKIPKKSYASNFK